jgi:hypothetical protein
VFTTRTISEIAKNIRDQSFILRYVSAEDLRFALRSMSNLDIDGKSPFDRWTQLRGSHVPTITVYFDVGLTMRALMKIGVNLLAAYCTKTPVHCDTFRTAIRLILGKTQPDPQKHLAGNGFVHAEDIQAIAQTGCHSFRLLHMGGQWMIYSSFFGGRIGSAVTFPGPNYEDWGTLDVVAPVHSKDWTVTRASLAWPLKMRVEWNTSALIAPSLKWQSCNSALLVEQVPVKRS